MPITARTQADRQAILSQVPLLAGLRAKDLRHLARACQVVSLAAYSPVVQQGEPGDAGYVIIDGTAEVRRNQRKVAELGPGAVFGEMAIVDGGPRSASVTMRTQGELLRIPQGAFDELLGASPEAARRLIAHLSGRIRELDRALYG
jgi:CRP/FNR family transcriptional regulator, cyclic AMP receptor protein